MIMFVEVAFPISSYTQFTYRIPKEFIDQIHVGIRIKAPLGKRLVTGIVVAKSAESDYSGTCVRTTGTVMAKSPTYSRR